MNKGLYDGVAAMASAEKRLESIVSNLANLNVNGFKRHGSSTESFDAVLRGVSRRQVTTRTSIDFQQGTLRPTGNDYDLALAGQGFFSIETPEGEKYTRDGQFRVDEQGVLQTHSGSPVAWAGARGTIDPLGESVRFDKGGVVWQGSANVGRIKLTNFENTEGLTHAGTGLFHRPDSLNIATHTAEVRQGYLERANVNAVDEMVGMISAQRSFESASRLLSMIDQTYRRLTTSQQ